MNRLPESQNGAETADESSNRRRRFAEMSASPPLMPPQPPPCGGDNGVHIKKEHLNGHPSERRAATRRAAAGFEDSIVVPTQLAIEQHEQELGGDSLRRGKLIEWDTHSLLPSRIRTPHSDNERVIVGRALTTAKAHLEHGEFGSWLASVAQFSARRAREYMALAEEHDRPAVDRWEREQRENQEAMIRDLSEALGAGECIDMQVEIVPTLSVEQADLPNSRVKEVGLPPIRGSMFYDRSKFEAEFRKSFANHHEHAPPGCYRSIIGLLLDLELRVTVGDSILAMEREAIELRARLKALDDAQKHVAHYPDNTPLWFAGESAAFHCTWKEGDAPYADSLTAGDFEIVARHERVESVVKQLLARGGIGAINLPPEHPLRKDNWPLDADEESAAMQRLSMVLSVLDQDEDLLVFEELARYGCSHDDLMGMLDGKFFDASYIGALATLAGFIAAAQADEIEDENEANALFRPYVVIAATRVHNMIIEGIHSHPCEIPAAIKSGEEQ